MMKRNKEGYTTYLESTCNQMPDLKSVLEVLRQMVIRQLALERQLAAEREVSMAAQQQVAALTAELEIAANTMQKFRLLPLERWGGNTSMLA